MSRWSHLARHGLLGSTLLAIAAQEAVAEPCADEAASSVSVVLGFDVSPKLKPLIGLEGRHCLGDKGELFARFQIGGGTRLIAGTRIRPLETMTEDSDRELIGLEAGLAVETSGELGAHLAATYGYHFAYLAAQGLFPLSGHARPTRASLLFGVSPWTLGDRTTATPGRPLIDGEMIYRPAIAHLPDATSAEDRAVRDHFAAAAQFELSSVWTFLRLAAELAAVGAPAALVARALDAAEDELRHAELCAREAGGVTLTALPMAVAQARFVARSPRALGTLAREAWLEGCLGEGAAAEEARLAAAACTGPTPLGAIAEDEQRHAELSWAVLAWVFAVAPEAARVAVDEAPHIELPSMEVGDPALARRGVASPQVVREARARATSLAQARYRALAA